MTRKLPSLEQRLSLGEGMQVSPFCLGATRRPEAVLAAYDAGVNFFFLTADMHWPLYEPLRRGIAQLLARGGGIRDRIVVIATAYVTQPDFCEAPFQEVLQSLPALERLDALSMGGVYANDFSQRLPIYRRHRAKQFCGARAIGASFHDRPTAAIAIEHKLIDVAFVRYNALHLGAREDLFARMPAARPLLYNFKSTSAYVAPEWMARLGFQDSAWRPEVADHYRFALSAGALDGVLLALDSAEQIEALQRALQRGPLDPEQETLLTQLARRAQDYALRNAAASR